MDLFIQLGNDSQQALAAIMRQYKMPLVYYVRRFVRKDELVKEVFLDTMLALWLQRKEIARKEDPVAWMIRIAHNKAVNKTRDEKKQAAISLENIPYPISASGNGELTLEGKELEGLLQKAVEQLSPREKLVFILNKKEGLDKKEIAEIYDVSENTVRNQLSSSMKKIRKYLSDLFASIFV